MISRIIQIWAKLFGKNAEPVGHNYAACTASLQRAIILLQRLKVGSKPAPREAVFYANLVEGVKIMTVIRHLIGPVEDPRLLSTESTECLTRLLGIYSGDEAFLRFIKTSDESMARGWADWQRKHPEVETKQLPNYAQMADQVDPSGAATRTYSQLSHLAHPRSSIPYLVAERTQCKARGITPFQYFELRCNQIVPIAVSALDEIISVAYRELHPVKDT